MTKEKVLVVGLGEVGRPMFELLKESGKFAVYGIDVDAEKMRQLGVEAEKLPSKVDVLHICIPCNDQKGFAQITDNYIERFKPNLTIVNSTVPPGTTMSIYTSSGCLVAHSPIRGIHKSVEHMKWEFKRWTKYVGGATQEAGKLACEHFEKIGLKTKLAKSCVETELAKLFETTYRAWMIACFQEMHRISMTLKADFDDVVDFLEDTHRVRLDRPIMFPDVISGHCLIPNVKLLREAYDSEFLKLILKSNEKRKDEIKAKNVLDEVNKVKRRVEKLEKEIQKPTA